MSSLACARVGASRRDGERTLRIPPVQTVAILGAGPIGAATAHRLAERSRIDAVVLIDENVAVAQGKALDIRQSGPVLHFDTQLSAAADILAAVSASVIVIADTADGSTWEGERGLSLMRQMVRSGTKAPFVFAAPSQAALMESCYRELKIPSNRLIGSGAGAVVSAVRALAGLELSLSTVSLTVVGRPPALTVAWSAATADGVLLTERVPAHRLRAISDLMPRLWPPNPYAIASGTCPVVEGLLRGSRRLTQALTIVDGDLGSRGSAALLPLELGDGRVKSYVVPSLSPQERTEMLSSIGGN